MKVASGESLGSWTRPVYRPTPRLDDTNSAAIPGGAWDSAPAVHRDGGGRPRALVATNAQHFVPLLEEMLGWQEAGLWLGRGRRPTLATIERALAVLWRHGFTTPLPVVRPTVDAGVVLEWRSAGVDDIEIEVLPDGAIEFMIASSDDVDTDETDDIMDPRIADLLSRVASR